MLDALIGGRLHARPVQRTGASGKHFTTAKLIVTAGSGETQFVNVIAFNESAQATLLALDSGDSIALSGPLTPKVWTGNDGVAKVGLDLVAHAVLTAYAVQHKRRASAPADEGQPA
jgi:single-stranded DNA-binding protein